MHLHYKAFEKFYKRVKSLKTQMFSSQLGFGEKTVNLEWREVVTFHLCLAKSFIHRNKWIKSVKAKLKVINNCMGNYFTETESKIKVKSHAFWVNCRRMESFPTQHYCFNQLPLKQTDRAFNSRTKLFTTIPRAMITDKTSLRQFRVKGRWGIET